MPIELFTVDDGVHGRELWRTDGTATGTFLVKDILPGSVGSDLANFTTVGSQVFFTASDRQFGPVQLWVTDGTAAGTVKVSATISGAENFVAYNGFLYFNGQNNFASRSVFRTDGTAAGTVLVSASTFDFYTPTVSNGLIYFVGNGGSPSFQEPWVSDGTAAGTHLLKDINPNGNSLSPFSTNFTPVGSLTFFTAKEPTHGSELWVTDGTTSGTMLVQDMNPGTSDSDPSNFIAAGSRLVFTANGGHLYGSDGTDPGTVALPVNNSAPAPLPRNGPSNLFQLDAGTVTFFGSDASHPFGLFRTNGTAAGTSFIAAINNDGYKPALLNGFEYVYGSDGVQSGLFRTDGTAGGTSFVAATGSFYNATVSNGRIFFTGSDAQGSELWVTDGTAPGTGRVTDIVPGSGSSSPSLLSAYGNGVIFTATEPVHGTEVYFSDGTTTTRASDIAMPAGSGITFFIPPRRRAAPYVHDPAPERHGSRARHVLGHPPQPRPDERPGVRSRHAPRHRDRRRGPRHLVARCDARAGRPLRVHRGRDRQRRRHGECRAHGTVRGLLHHRRHGCAVHGTDQLRRRCRTPHHQRLPDGRWQAVSAAVLRVRRSRPARFHQHHLRRRHRQLARAGERQPELRQHLSTVRQLRPHDRPELHPGGRHPVPVGGQPRRRYQRGRDLRRGRAGAHPADRQA